MPNKSPIGQGIAQRIYCVSIPARRFSGRSIVVVRIVWDDVVRVRFSAPRPIS